MIVTKIRVGPTKRQNRTELNWTESSVQFSSVALAPATLYYSLTLCPLDHFGSIEFITRGQFQLNQLSISHCRRFGRWLFMRCGCGWFARLGHYGSLLITPWNGRAISLRR